MSEVKNRGGRPRKIIKMTERITILCDMALKARCVELAENSGKSLSTWGREIIEVPAREE